MSTVKNLARRVVRPQWRSARRRRDGTSNSIGRGILLGAWVP
ncbi:MAG: hypothetical protein SGJ09_03070 [Phycisphaerae bacterium]|nr:hypothetical protein [Phycisphaerae bacterium]